MVRAVKHQCAELFVAKRQEREDLILLRRRRNNWSVSSRKSSSSPANLCSIPEDGDAVTFDFGGCDDDDDEDRCCKDRLEVARDLKRPSSVLGFSPSYSSVLEDEETEEEEEEPTCHRSPVSLANGYRPVLLVVKKKPDENGGGQMKSTTSTNLPKRTNHQEASDIDSRPSGPKSESFSRRDLMLGILDTLWRLLLVLSVTAFCAFVASIILLLAIDHW